MVRRTLELVRRALSRHTTVAAYLALLLASSTATYAATTVGSAQVINDSLQSVDLKDGAAVGGVDVINDSLTGIDVKEATLNGAARAIVYREIPDQTVGPMKLVASAGGYDLLTTVAKFPSSSCLCSCGSEDHRARSSGSIPSGRRTIQTAEA